MNKNLYIGLMSGTSADAIDATIVDFKENEVNIIHKNWLFNPSKDKRKNFKF